MDLQAYADFLERAHVKEFRVQVPIPHPLVIRHEEPLPFGVQARPFRIVPNVDRSTREAARCLRCSIIRCSMRKAEWERRFLMRLAATWLGCRWQVMGGAVDTPWCKGYAEGSRGLEFALLGMVDYDWAMELEVSAVRLAAHHHTASA